MSAQYINIGQVISRVGDNLPNIDLSQEADKIYRWVFELELRIGSRNAALPHKECVIDIVNFRGKLPFDFYKINAVKTGECECATFSGADFTYWNQDSPYLANRNPVGNGFTLLSPFYFGDVQYKISSREYIDLSNNIPNVGISYQALPLDKDGLPLVNSLHQLAVAAGVTFNILKSRYFSEKCSRQLYLDAKAEWEQEKTRAQYIDAEVSYDEAKYIGQIVSSHYIPNSGNTWIW